MFSNNNLLIDNVTRTPIVSSSSLSAPLNDY